MGKDSDEFKKLKAEIERKLIMKGKLIQEEKPRAKVKKKNANLSGKLKQVLGNFSEFVSSTKKKGPVTISNPILLQNAIQPGTIPQDPRITAVAALAKDGAALSPRKPLLEIPPPTMPPELFSKALRYKTLLEKKDHVGAFTLLKDMKLQEIQANYVKTMLKSDDLSEVFKQQNKKLRQEKAPAVAAKPGSLEKTRENIDSIVAYHCSNTNTSIPTLQSIKTQIDSTSQDIKTRFDNLGASKHPIQDITELLDVLDKAVDLKIGIIRTSAKDGIAHLGSAEKGKSSVIMRDARYQMELQSRSKSDISPITLLTKPEEAPEASMTIILAQARGILKLIEMDKSMPTEDRTQLQSKVLQQLNAAQENISNTQDQARRSKMVHQFNDIISDELRKSGLQINGQEIAKLSPAELVKTMLYTRDFSNFESKDHPTIISISSNIAQDIDQPLYQVSTSVPLTPVGKDLKAYYKNLDTQPWFQTPPLDKITQALIKEYTAQIQDGHHMIPTQLRELVGIKNGYLEQTSIVDKKGTMQDSAILMRSATLAHNLGIGKEMSEITEKNMLHMQDLTGGKNLIMDSLNHNLGEIMSSLSADIYTERKIQQAMQAVATKLENKGISFENDAISLSFNKNKNLLSIEDHYFRLNSKDKTIQAIDKPQVLCISCKSGKDRTGLAALESAMQWVLKSDKFKDKLHKKADTFMVSMAHQEQMTATNTRGIWGLKVNSVFMGMNKKHKIKHNASALEQDIAQLNYVKALDKPKDKPMQKLIQAVHRNFSSRI